MTAEFHTRAFELLGALEQDNSTEWFSRHRQEFRAELTDPMVQLLTTLTDRLVDSAWPLAGGHRTMMRQHRDTRFATTPYHVTIRGLMSRSGRPLGMGEAGAHIEVGTQGGFVGVGLHRPAAAVLRPIRERMLDEPARVEGVVGNLAAAGLELVEDPVATMPRGFASSSDHAMAPYVRQRSLTVVRELPRSMWETAAAIDEIERVVRASAPLLAFVSEGVSDS